ncbi:phage protein [Streptococcus pneumoniae]|nr:phage protein [Streptococcus pneumoniae]VKK26007.1 phage protein [Streptococcus pneumoniae]VQP80101.1 phage protein [Streptococcus pneumoniae]
MNKQELIKKLEERRTIIGNFQGYAVWWKDVKEIFEQLDELQPVKVPQCVAEYIEFKKKNNFHVYGAMRVIEDHYDKKVPEWFYENNIEKFCLAWLNGYEVEKEKRYFVKIKGNIKENMLVYGELLKRYFFTKSFSLDDVIYSHTRKQLEDANFGWVFDCEGIEIEEVE